MPSAVRSVGSSSKGDRHDHHRRAIGRRERDGWAGDTIALQFGHPIRSFALTLTALALVAVACWWFGLVAPRLETTLGPVGGGTDSVIVTVKISNPTAPSVRLLGVDLRARGLRIDRVVDGAEGSTRAFRPIRLASSEQRVVTLIGHATRCGQDVSFSDGDLVVRARTALGIRRSLRPSIGVYNLGSPLAPCSDS